MARLQNYLIGVGVMIIGLAVLPPLIPIFLGLFASTDGVLLGGCKVGPYDGVYVPTGKQAAVTLGVEGTAVCATTTSDVAVTYNGADTTMTYVTPYFEGNSGITLLRVIIEWLPIIAVIGGLFWILWSIYKDFLSPRRRRRAF